MKKIQLLLILLLMSLGAYAQDGFYNISEEKIKKTYDEISPLGKYRFDSLSYEHARSQTEYIFEEFNYKSDNFEIIGFSCRPKLINGKKIPVIIYNRGGTGNIGKLNEEDFPDFYTLAKEGFVVFASNYRYVGELGAIDQIGGDDLNDVINLYEIVQKLDYVDNKNIFMVGISRGGLMTYKSLTKIDLNAAAVLGGTADLEDLTNRRPIFLTGWSDLEENLNYAGLQNVLPNFEDKREEYFKQRSAPQWADEINTPIFILHSRQDGRVPLSGPLKLIARLYEFNKEFKV
ncbi:alpha/beta hydrolase family protein, partial [Xanthovirga aplysinae]|uniref:alpha/beta hydrolase family protein n=1 Tax=Xanthovirga aplysinae TaxID=2529853 RepID=UPI0012BBA7CF